MLFNMRGVPMTRLAPWVLAALLGVCCAWLIQRASRVQDDAARAVEATRLAADGQIVEAQRTAKQIEAEKDAMAVGNEALRLALAAAHKAAPGAKVVRTMRASTGPMVAGGAPRECPVSNREQTTQSTQSPTQSASTCPVCLVAPGDSLEVRVAEVDLHTKAGNRVVVGSGECLRVLPLPETSLARGPFEASLTTVHEFAPPVDDRWPWYVHGAIGLGVGLVAGVMVAK